MPDFEKWLADKKKKKLEEARKRQATPLQNAGLATPMGISREGTAQMRRPETQATPLGMAGEETPGFVARLSGEETPALTPGYVRGFSGEETPRNPISNIHSESHGGAGAAQVGLFGDDTPAVTKYEFAGLTPGPPGSGNITPGITPMLVKDMKGLHGEETPMLGQVSYPGEATPRI